MHYNKTLAIKKLKVASLHDRLPRIHAGFLSLKPYSLTQLDNNVGSTAKYEHACSFY